MAEQTTLQTGVADAAGWERLLRGVVGPFAKGSLSVDLPSGRRVVLKGEHSGHDAHVAVHRWRALRRVAFGGDIGFAQAIGDGECTSADLKSFLLWTLDNTGANGSIGDTNLVWQLASRLRHGLRSNTRRNSRRNISAHYDLGNAFYAAWLDEGLNYSSGIYDAATATLEQAQLAKLARIADLLNLDGGERILEIGCGWGALAHRLAAGHHCHVTGLTLSTEQLTCARARLSGVPPPADLRLQDYRDVTGEFDRIVSIEMMEAVGEAFWPTYFSKIASCLSRDGTAVIQAITIDEARFEAYRQRPDFIQLTIFPGGMLPTKSIIAAQAARAGLQLVRAEHFGASYRRTLADWRLRFAQAWPAIEGLGFDDRFRRLWDYYLVYCEVGFETGWLDVGLYQLQHPGSPTAP